MFDYTSFSHGQIKSKLWLAEKIEKFSLGNDIVVLGSWYNLTAFVLKSRGVSGKITGIDIDPKVKPIADKICDLWLIDGTVENITGDAKNITVPYNTIINCSSEHMSTEWFDNIDDGTLVCIQSSNITDPNDPWFITTASPTIESFKEKYKCSAVLDCDTLRIQYGDWGYDRYMLIGIK